MTDDGPWFTEHEDAGEPRWAVTLPAAELSGLGLTLRTVGERLGRHGPALPLQRSDGSPVSHEELAGLRDSHVVALGAALARYDLDAAELAGVASVATDLEAVSDAALAVGNHADADHDGLVSARRFLERLLEQAVDALDRRVTRRDDGKFLLRWTRADRALVSELSDELDALLDSDDPSLVRLFPPAYGSDADRTTGYWALARDELVASKRASLGTVRDALDRSVVDEEELNRLMRAVNDLRLVLGTRLDVSEDDTGLPPVGHPDRARWLAYHQLTGLLARIIRALGSPA